MVGRFAQKSPWGPQGRKDGMLRFQKRVLTSLEGVYCLELFETDGRVQVVAASEIHDGICKTVDFGSRSEELVWPGPGGCMNVCQLDVRGGILAIWDFYKGFQSKEAKLVRADRNSNGTWSSRVLAVLPYLHRCGVVEGPGGPYVVASILCGGRESADDWSRPGWILAGCIPRGDEPLSLEVIQTGVTKNHGFWQGIFDGEQVTLISGSEGILRVRPPEEVGEPWRVDRLLDREISDMAVCDIDGDGEDELLTFEGFHGNLAAVNKRIGGTWTIIYTVPMDFAHGIWGGTLAGRGAFVAGSRKGAGDLFLIRQGAGGLETVLIEHGAAPSNIRSLSLEGQDYILCAERDGDCVSLYEVSEEESACP